MVLAERNPEFFGLPKLMENSPGLTKSFHFSVSGETGLQLNFAVVGHLFIFVCISALQKRLHHHHFPFVPKWGIGLQSQKRLHYVQNLPCT